MLRIGLTGGIGAGKSAVADRLAGRGAVVIDSDAVAREVVEPGTPGLLAVVAEFGEGVLTAEGALDRPALGRLVFADDRRLAALNAILHPLIGARSAELVARAPHDAVVVHDVPLLVENDLASGFPLVVVVDAPEQTRLDRLQHDRGMSADEARSRLEAQATDEQRRAAADVLLANDGTLAELRSRVDNLYDDRLVPFLGNLVAGRPAGTTGVAMHPYDPTWPHQYDRIADRLRTACGDLARRVDHIGSTAVPGLAAEDVIDVMVTVPDLGTADDLRVPLERAGYPAVARITRDDPRPAGSDPARWGKRFHGSADPGRRTNVHLRVEGSPGWLFALAFRDWLRADADVREEYAVAKEPWFDQAWPRVQDWVGRTGWRPTR